MTELVGRATRLALREHLVDFTLHEINMAFDAVGLSADHDFHPSVSGQRRTLVEQYFHRVNWNDVRDTKKVLRLFESLLVEMDANISQIDGPHPAKDYRAKLRTTLERDGLRFENGKLRPTSDHRHLTAVGAAIGKLDAPELARQLDRIRESIDEDPALAIGTAKELVESACKTILEERGIATNSEWDLTRLAKETRDSLRLLPENIPDRSKGLDAIRKLLANLGVVVQALSEVRNLYGTGHGRTGNRNAIQGRHARLAVGAATTLSTILLETHWDRQDDTPSGP